MRFPHIIRIFFSFLFGILLLSACDLTDPSRVDRPTLLTAFYPNVANLRTFLGDTLRFSIAARDPDGNQIKIRFLLGDSLVSNAGSWHYVVQDTGWITVKGIATDGGKPVEVSWEVERLKPENMPPKIISFEPVDPNPSVIIDHQLNFTILAEDPEGEPLMYYYMIGDSVVSPSRHYAFLATAFGEVEIVAYVKDPEEHFNFRRWTVLVTGYPDSIPPAQVEILSLEAGLEPGELIVRWIAVGEDGMEGMPAYYQVRTSPVPIINEYNWERASRRSGVPPLAPPGEIMEMVVQELIPADWVHICVRALDEFNNISPLSVSPGAQVKGYEIYGQVRNSVTNDPIEGIKVIFKNIISGETYTDIDGRFAFTELPPYSGEILGVDEEDPESYGTYFDFCWPYTVDSYSHNDTLHFWMLPNLQLDTELYTSFFSFFKHMTDTYNHPFGNILRTWEPPVAIYVKPFTKNGLDYAAVIEGVLDEYETITGMDLFDIVADPPEVGVRTVYLDNLFADKYGVEEWSDGMQFPVKGLLSFRTGYTPGTIQPFQKVIRHEVGHALGMKHSDDTNHLMYGGVDCHPEVTHLSQDELQLLLSMYHLPRGMLMSWYRFD